MSEKQETHIMIRWHGLRKYQGDGSVVGMRGYPVTDGSEIYELDPTKEGEWELTYRYAVLDDGIGSESRWKVLATDKDLYKVIQAAEEHAFRHAELIAIQEYEDEQS